VVDLTAAHWVYLIGIVVILATMVMRKNIVVPAVTMTFLTALVYSKSLVTGLSAVFNASLVAAVNLFNIFLIIALVTAMLGALQALGADRKMVAPFRRVMRNPHLAYWGLAVVTYFISLFFWPTPAVPLIGAVLIPVAIRAGLPAMSVGLVIAIAGQGMALSSDYVIRVAPGLSAKSAGANIDTVADRAMVLSLITGGVALVAAYVMELRRFRKPSDELLTQWELAESTGVLVQDEDQAREQGIDVPAETTVAMGGSRAGVAQRGATATLDPPDVGTGRSEPTIGHGVALRGTPAAGATTDPVDAEPVDPRWGSLFAVIVPLAYLALIVYMLVAKLSDSVPDLAGGDAAALVGGIAAMLLFLAAAAKDGVKSLETSAAHVVDGLVFAFKAMGVVLPIAGFFFIGNGDFSAQILGIAAPGKGPALLYDLVNSAQSHIPQNGLIAGFGILIIGMIAGLEGSGFSGLPLTGSLAGSLGPATGTSTATLAAVGQMGNIWSGGGTLVAWSSLIAVAGFARVPVVELARRCFIPVVAGLIISTLVGVIVFG
jgi:hypothetical protein